LRVLAQLQACDIIITPQQQQQQQQQPELRWGTDHFGPWSCFVQFEAFHLADGCTVCFLGLRTQAARERIPSNGLKKLKGQVHSE